MSQTQFADGTTSSKARPSRTRLAWTLMIVGTLFVVIADSLAHIWLFSGSNFAPRETLEAWVTNLRYFGGAGLLMGAIERLAQAIQNKDK